eukprot:gb/GEZN01000153.1/.p1 GENE.gb/GEZN01000153.1/~~gb/GEZN01000153.1/.p1  ORF type:complete len:2139 (-),score=387.81 gb/GEZN01000153.1/:12-6428(-)
MGGRAESVERVLWTLEQTILVNPLLDEATLHVLLDVQLTTSSTELSSSLLVVLQEKLDTEISARAEPSSGWWIWFAATAHVLVSLAHSRGYSESKWLVEKFLQQGILLLALAPLERNVAVASASGSTGSLGSIACELLRVGRAWERIDVLRLETLRLVHLLLKGLQDDKEKDRFDSVHRLQLNPVPFFELVQHLLASPCVSRQEIQPSPMVKIDCKSREGINEKPHCKCLGGMDKELFQHCLQLLPLAGPALFKAIAALLQAYYLPDKGASSLPGEFSVGWARELFGCLLDMWRSQVPDPHISAKYFSSSATALSSSSLNSNELSWAELVPVFSLLCQFHTQLTAAHPAKLKSFLLEVIWVGLQAPIRQFRKHSVFLIQARQAAAQAVPFAASCSTDATPDQPFSKPGRRVERAKTQRKEKQRLKQETKKNSQTNQAQDKEREMKLEDLVVFERSGDLTDKEWRALVRLLEALEDNGVHLLQASWPELQTLLEPCPGVSRPGRARWLSLFLSRALAAPDPAIRAFVTNWLLRSRGQAKPDQPQSLPAEQGLSLLLPAELALGAVLEYLMAANIYNWTYVASSLCRVRQKHQARRSDADTSSNTVSQHESNWQQDEKSGEGRQDEESLTVVDLPERVVQFWQDYFHSIPDNSRSSSSSCSSVVLGRAWFVRAFLLRLQTLASSSMALLVQLTAASLWSPVPALGGSEEEQPVQGLRCLLQLAQTISRWPSVVRPALYHSLALVVCSFADLAPMCTRPMADRAEEGVTRQLAHLLVALPPPTITHPQTYRDLETLFERNPGWLEASIEQMCETYFSEHESGSSLLPELCLLSAWLPASCLLSYLTQRNLLHGQPLRALCLVGGLLHRTAVWTDLEPFLAAGARTVNQAMLRVVQTDLLPDKGETVPGKAVEQRQPLILETLADQLRSLLTAEPWTEASKQAKDSLIRLVELLCRFFGAQLILCQPITAQEQEGVVSVALRALLTGRSTLLPLGLLPALRRLLAALLRAELLSPSGPTALPVLYGLLCFCTPISTIGVEPGGSGLLGLLQALPELASDVASEGEREAKRRCDAAQTRQNQLERYSAGLSCLRDMLRSLDLLSAPACFPAACPSALAAEVAQLSNRLPVGHSYWTQLFQRLCHRVESSLGSDQVCLLEVLVLLLPHVLSPDASPQQVQQMLGDSTGWVTQATAALLEAQGSEGSPTCALLRLLLAPQLRNAVYHHPLTGSSTLRASLLSLLRSPKPKLCMIVTIETLAAWLATPRLAHHYLPQLTELACFPSQKSTKQTYLLERLEQHSWNHLSHSVSGRLDQILYPDVLFSGFMLSDPFKTGPTADAEEESDEVQQTQDQPAWGTFFKESSVRLTVMSFLEHLGDMLAQTSPSTTTTAARASSKAERGAGAQEVLRDEARGLLVALMRSWLEQVGELGRAFDKTYSRDAFQATRYSNLWQALCVCGRFLPSLGDESLVALAASTGLAELQRLTSPGSRHLLEAFLVGLYWQFPSSLPGLLILLDQEQRPNVTASLVVVAGYVALLTQQPPDRNRDNSPRGQHPQPILLSSAGDCMICGLAARFSCSRCGDRRYCGRACQRREWGSHKAHCRPEQKRKQAAKPHATSLSSSFSTCPSFSPSHSASTTSTWLAKRRELQAHVMGAIFPLLTCNYGHIRTVCQFFFYGLMTQLYPWLLSAAEGSRRTGSTTQLMGPGPPGPHEQVFKYLDKNQDQAKLRARISRYFALHDPLARSFVWARRGPTKIPKHTLSEDLATTLSPYLSNLTLRYDDVAWKSTLVRQAAAQLIQAQQHDLPALECMTVREAHLRFDCVVKGLQETSPYALEQLTLIDEEFRLARTISSGLARAAQQAAQQSSHGEDEADWAWLVNYQRKAGGLSLDSLMDVLGGEAHRDMQGLPLQQANCPGTGQLAESGTGAGIVSQRARLDAQLNTTRGRRRLVVVASLLTKAPNLGGLARTCEIFQAELLVVHNLQVVKSPDFESVSVSAHKWLPMAEVSEQRLPFFLQQKRKQGFSVLALEQAVHSVSLENFSFPDKAVLLLGKEKTGVPVELLNMVDFCVEIPQFGIIRSLNVHVSAAIMIWSFARHHLLKNDEPRSNNSLQDSSRSNQARTNNALQDSSQSTQTCNATVGNKK